jgi:hypothetical protein
LLAQAALYNTAHIVSDANTTHTHKTVRLTPRLQPLVHYYRLWDAVGGVTIVDHDFTTNYSLWDSQFNPTERLHGAIERKEERKQ